MADEIRIGYLTTLYHTSLILRGSGRVDEDLGLNTSWKRFPNGPSMIEAFERSDLDLGYMGLPPAMIGICHGLDIRCVAGGHMEGTVLIGPKGFNAGGEMRVVLAQFKGRCIGTPRRGTIHDVILRKLLSESGLSSMAEVRNFDYADFIVDAMADGEIDGGCGTPPLAVLARRQIGAKILIPPSRMWPFNPSYGILASERLIQDQGPDLEGFIRLHEEACNLIRERPKKAAELVHEATGIIEEDFALEVFGISPKYCASLPGEYIRSSMAFVQVLMDMGYITRPLDKDEVFYTRAIEKVHPAQDHYGDPGKLRQVPGDLHT
ncbi:MAG TPA: ABC transporter substrate-binding protein [Methanotrichaceae archaeon]|nr:ABC transporter substrate-binding protein [Methanotrichaceae archaeon]